MRTWREVRKFASQKFRLTPDFQGFCSDFQQIKTFGGALATPVPSPPTPLLFITVS